MFAKLRALPPRAALLFGVTVSTLVLLGLLRLSGVVSPNIQLYVITPLTYAVLAVAAYFLLDGTKSHVRHQRHREQVVLGVFAVWFVV